MRGSPRRSRARNVALHDLRDLAAHGANLRAGRFAPTAYRATSGAVAEALHACLFGAVAAAENAVIGFETMADDAHAAMGARRRERVDRAFEAVERLCPAALGDLESLVVVVTASVAFRHGGFS